MFFIAHLGSLLWGFVVHMCVSSCSVWCWRACTVLLCIQPVVWVARMSKRLVWVLSLGQLGV